MDGILLIDKPKGWTSHDAVAKVRNYLSKKAGKKVKVGHTGTLDPLATGLLVLVVGNYCKRAGEFSGLDKTYDVDMKLGETSTTGDAEGTIESTGSKQVEVSELENVLKLFTGEIEQIPPAFSAIKIGGKRAYKLARAGKEVKLEPRRVTINDIKLTDYNYPCAKFTSDVSSGTYIRSLVVDVGEKLGIGAYMSGLKRIKVGKYSIDDSIDPRRLDEITAEKLLAL